MKIRFAAVILDSDVSLILLFNQNNVFSHPFILLATFWSHFFSCRRLFTSTALLSLLLRPVLATVLSSTRISLRVQLIIRLWTQNSFGDVAFFHKYTKIIAYHKSIQMFLIRLSPCLTITILQYTMQDMCDCDMGACFHVSLEQFKSNDLFNDLDTWFGIIGMAFVCRLFGS